MILVPIRSLKTFANYATPRFEPWTGGCEARTLPLSYVVALVALTVEYHMLIRCPTFLLTPSPLTFGKFHQWRVFIKIFLNKQRDSNLGRKELHENADHWAPGSHVGDATQSSGTIKQPIGNFTYGSPIAFIIERHYTNKNAVNGLESTGWWSIKWAISRSGDSGHQPSVQDWPNFSTKLWTKKLPHE